MGLSLFGAGGCGATFAAFCIIISGSPASAKATFATFEAGFVTGINSANTATGWREGGDSFIRTADGTITTFAVQGASATEAEHINDLGAVAGFYRDSSGNIHGFVRAAEGTIATFDVQNADGTGPHDINNKGVVVGYYYDDAGNHGFVRASGGSTKTFDVSASTDTRPLCINDKGVIGGTYFSDDGHSHGFVRSPSGAITTFDVPGALFTSADCINVKGAVAGSYDTGDGIKHGFVRTTDGAITTFDGQDCSIFTVGINRKGVIAGGCEDHQNAKHFVGFVRKPNGTINEFHVPDGGSGTMPSAINDAGVIAGDYKFGNFLRFP